MSDDLVKRLRAVDHLSVEDCFLESSLYAYAADRIEALDRNLDAALKTLATFQSANRNNLSLQREATARAETAEARLAKALGALQTTTQILSQCLFETILVKGQYLDRKEVVASARATLAEIEGGNDV